MTVYTVGFKELKAAVKRNPQLVASETKKFMTRGMSKYKRGILNDPWRVGSRGGGAPTDTGHMRDLHVTKVSNYKASIGPNLVATPYARYVHEGTRRGLAARPWLDYVKKRNEHRIQSLYRELLKNITKDLAR